jgi:FkbH-like protein
MELAEVKAAWPDIHCLLFPKNEPRAVLALLRELRDLFGKNRVAMEDGLRLASIRAAADRPSESSQGAGQEAFLSQAEATLTAQFSPPSTDSRIVELVNKTNQFNLNGIRYGEAEWWRTFGSKDSFVLAVAYEDKYGPLGKIAVLAGRREEGVLRVQAWVMSCRAFSRRIEHCCLQLLFSHFRVEEVRFDYIPTPRNGPFRECLSGLLSALPDGPLALTRTQFLQTCPQLYCKTELIK